MSFIPDEQEKTVKIPIQVRAGQIQFYFDGPLPDLKEGIIGDLVVPYYTVLDPKARKLFSEERKIPLFKKKTLLYVQLRPLTPDDAKPFDAHLLRPFPKGTLFYVQLDQETPEGGKSVVAQLHDHSFDTQRVFTTIELQDALWLQLRGTKAPTLSETACKTPTLDKESHKREPRLHSSCPKRLKSIESRTRPMCSNRSTFLGGQIACVPSIMCDMTGRCSSRSDSANHVRAGSDLHRSNKLYDHLDQKYQ
jgi:hypothetical protein